MSEAPARPGGIGMFSVLWFGQLVSQLGSGLTGFALGIWVYQSTGSVTRFALISLFTSLPGIVLSPVAGVLVDRWDRRLLMLASNIGSAVCMMGIVIPLWLDRLAIWHIYVVLGLSSVFRAIQWPALAATTTLMLPRKHYGRASGMMNFGEALALIMVPALAGMMIARVGLSRVILLDLLSFLFAAVTLVVVRIPRPDPASATARRGTMKEEIRESWTYLRQRPGLMALLLLFAGSNFAVAMLQVLLTPLVLSFTTPQILGRVLSVATGGFLLGGLTMSVWGGPKRRVLGIYLFQTLQGTILLLAALDANAPLIAGAGFFFFACASIVNGSNQAIWQTTVAPEVQGRVFALRRMVVSSALPLAYLVGGPLADHVFEPLLAPGGLLAGSLGSVIGTGKGRGVALMILLLGIWVITIVNIAYRYRPVRQLEES